MDPGHLEGQGLDSVSEVGLWVRVGKQGVKRNIESALGTVKSCRFPKDREQKRNKRTFLSVFLILVYFRP